MHHDVIIVGASFAGLSAAMYIASTGRGGGNRTSHVSPAWVTDRRAAVTLRHARRMARGSERQTPPNAIFSYEGDFVSGRPSVPGRRRS
jgi:glycine/D-amino acid oxidase-like deaminating enzyme